MEEAECVCPAVHHLVEPPSTSQLTYQQFINCAYLEILSFYASLVFVVPVPCACTGYLYVPYSGHVMGTGQTETMEVSDSLKKEGKEVPRAKANPKEKAKESREKARVIAKARGRKERTLVA